MTSLASLERVSAQLLFPDSRVAVDAATFIARAARMSDGAVRLRAQEGHIVMAAAGLAPDDLRDDTPTVLAMRVAPIDPELVCDLVVLANGVGVSADDPSALTLPDEAVTASWAGISPPRTGWEPAGSVRAADIASLGHRGIADVAASLPSDPGEDLVRRVRSEVWGRAESSIEGLPAGVAFAALTAGFIGGEEDVSVFRTGPWTRLRFARGYVLSRHTTRMGLTPVRATGV